jgi:serine/threonine protein phosphatase 1
MAVYVVSDLHGQYGMFQKLLEKVNFCDDDQLYMLGDAIDRGSDGIKILQHVMYAPNMHFLIGNHELMMLTSVAQDGTASTDFDKLPGRNADLWIHYNGGNKTYFQYKRLKKEERLKVLEWLWSCPLSSQIEVNGQSFVLTHSFFSFDKMEVPCRKIDYRTAWDIVWDSPFRFDLYVSTREYSKYESFLFIIGHVPTYHAGEKEGERPLSSYRVDNIIDIDGGCARHNSEDGWRKGGIILRLNDMKEFTISFDELRKMNTRKRGLHS